MTSLSENIKFTTKTKPFKFGLKQISLFVGGEFYGIYSDMEEVEDAKNDYIEHIAFIKTQIEAGRKCYSVMEMSDLFEDYLTANAIFFNRESAQTGSVYLTVAGRKLRFADHNRSAFNKWNFVHVQGEDFPSGWFTCTELKETFEKYSK